jgi:hypothetical protein
MRKNEFIKYIMEKTINKEFPISVINSLSEDVPTFIEL